MNHIFKKEVPTIYAAAPSEDHFSLEEVTLRQKGNGAVQVARKPVSRLEMIKKWELATKDHPEQPRAFLLACISVMAGDEDQRRIQERVTASRTRNIPFNIQTTKEFLKKAMSIKKEHKKVSPKEIDDLLQATFAPIKQQLGFPAKDPAECSYKVTGEVVAAATSEACIQYLEQQKPRVAIFPCEFELICQTLEKEHATDAEKVIAAIKTTKSREHIAALSLSTEGEIDFITIANVNRQFLKMESWRFIKLIEQAGEPLRLHVFEKIKRDATMHPFRFNNNRAGEVVAKFTPGKSCLEVACIQEGSSAILDKAAFTLDSTYTLCIFLTLKRLREDKAQFAKLLEGALCSPSVNDPFESIYMPMNG